MSYFFDGCFQVFCCDSFILSDDDCSFHLLPLATIFSNAMQFINLIHC
jgi:hypothetical protein